MIEQYKQETSQIHAPADLIRRTRQAVQEEEKRIQQEGIHQNPLVQTPKMGYKKIYRRLLTVAAAALFILFSVSTFALKNRVGKSGMSGSSADTGTINSMDELDDMGAAMPGQTAELEDDSLTEQIAGTEDIDLAGQIASSAGAGLSEQEPDGVINTEGAITGTLTNGAETAANMDSDSEADSVSEDYVEAQDKSDKEEKMADSYRAGKESEEVRASLSIEKIDKIPSFYGHSDMERIVLHEMAFYVVKEQDNNWSAYVHAYGTNYVITGSMDESGDGETFALEAYGLLTEKMEGTE